MDFAKAFDSLDWNFLLEILIARGFSSRWISWIQNILYYFKARALVNGEPHGFIRRYKRGLQQGDPLSPLFFSLATNTLSAMFTHVLLSKFIVGVPFGSIGNICQLQ